MFPSTIALAIATLGLTSSALAVPVRRAVSQALLDEFNLFSQYSAAAYCTADNTAASGADISCSAGNCPLVQQADAVTVYSFSGTGVGDVTGLLAVDTTNQLIVLSFRGSSSIDNWIANLKFALVDASSICSGCEAHDGFLSSWQSVSATLTSEVASTLAAHPGYRLVFTGHSLGAALATLGAVSLRNGGYAIDLYTYGCPRVGNTALATFITSQSGGTDYRATHTDDPVPKLPPLDFGYSQPSPEYWITSATNATVGTGDITEVVGINSAAGNDGTPIGLDINAHLWYFGPISACS